MKYISLFSGIEAASVAWSSLGWEPIAFAEIEPFPSQVLTYHFPNVPNLGDVTKVDWSKYHGKCDLIIGGSPCQSFSIAGLRKGLADPRGNLMLEYLRACDAIEPEWIIWENVPGVLSADNRRAFQTFLEAVAQLWPRGGCAWRILDAQFFGVAQRRRRVFVVINTRDWRRAAAVLFEPGCLRGDNPTSREKRQELTRAFGDGSEESGRVSEESTCIQGSMIGRADKNGPQGGGLNNNVSFTLNTSDRHAVAYGFVGEHGGNTGCGISEDKSPTIEASHAPSVLAFAQNSRDEVRIMNGDGQIVGALAAQPGMKQTCYVVAHAGEGKSEPVCMADATAKASVENGICGTFGAHSQKEPPIVCVADDNANAAVDEDLCGSLKVGGESVNSNGEEVIGALCARDYKGVGSQYVSEGKVICQKATS